MVGKEIVVDDYKKMILLSYRRIVVQWEVLQRKFNSVIFEVKKAPSVPHEVEVILNVEKQ